MKNAGKIILILAQTIIPYFLAAQDINPPVISGILDSPDPFIPGKDELVIEYRLDETASAIMEIKDSSNQNVKSFPVQTVNPQEKTPRLIHTAFDLHQSPQEAHFYKDFLFMGSNETLQAMNLANPLAPSIHTLAVPSAQGYLEIVGDFVYLTASDNLVKVDISNPSAPHVVALVSVGMEVRRLAASADGGYLFLLASDKIITVDITGSMPSVVAQTDLVADVSFADSFRSSGNYLYFASGITLYTYDVSDPLAPAAQPAINLEEIPFGEDPGIYEMEFSKDGSVMYALRSGISIFDLANPAQPAWLQNISVPEIITLNAYGDFLYANCTQQLHVCLRTYDVKVASAPEFVSEYQLGSVVPDGRAITAVRARGNLLVALNGVASILANNPLGSNRAVWDGRDQATGQFVAQGTYTYTITAQDLAGNQSQASGSFVVRRSSASSADGKAVLLSNRPDMKIVQVSTGSPDVSFALATAAAQGLSLVSAVYDITPSVSFSPLAELIIRYNPALVSDPSTLAIYRYDGVKWSSVTITNQMVLNGGDPRVVGNLASASFYALFIREAAAPPAVQVALNLDPNTVNLKSNGQFITAILEPSGSQTASNINASTLKITAINGSPITPISIVSKPAPSLGDADSNGIADLTVKFSREALQAVLPEGQAEIKIEGAFSDASALTASNSINVIKPGRGRADAGEFSVADATFKIGEIYAFPNPAVGSAVPNLHIETGLADSVRILLYTLSGELIREEIISGLPQIIDDGQGAQYAYEWAWEGHIPSGTYFYLIETKKGSETLRAKGKIYVVR